MSEREELDKAIQYIALGKLKEATDTLLALKHSIHEPPAPVQVTGDIYLAARELLDDLKASYSNNVARDKRAALEAALQAWAAEQQELTDLQAAMWQVADELKCRPTEIFDRLAKLRSLEVAPQTGVPSGWKLVPEEPTPEMLARGTKAADEKLAAWRGYDQNGTGLDGMHFCVREAFKAMLASAPAPDEGR